MSKKRTPRVRTPKAPKVIGTSTRGKKTSYKDVQIIYLLDGISAVEKLVAGRKAGPLLRKALLSLQAQARESTSLEKFIELNFPAKGRGRVMPEAGATRLYKAQQLGDGGPFLRLPLNSLEAKKGAALTVSFGADQIVVSKG